MILSKALPSKSKLVDQISKFFDKNVVNELSRSTKFVQRKSTLTGMDLLLLSVFSHQQSDEISLEGLSRELLKAGKNVAKQSVQDRFNERAVTFMQQMVNYALLQKLSTKAVVCHSIFNRIVIGDSTVFQLPPEFADKYKGNGGGASVSAVKIQYNYDLLSNRILVMHPQSGINSDNKQFLGELKKTTYV